MTRIISIHSFRRGTGKTCLTANAAALLAAEGRRIGVVDTDVQTPSLHILYGLEDELPPRCLNDYLAGQCGLRDAAYDVTERLGAPVAGQVWLVPASTESREIARLLREGYDVGRLHDGLDRLADDLGLDLLLLDTHAGLSEATLLSIAMSDALAIVLHPDQQGYQGTGVMVDVARKLDIPRMLLIVNKVPAVFDAGEVKTRVEQTYDCEVAAVVPHSNEMLALASSGIFALRYPHDPVTAQIRQGAHRLAE